MHLSEQFRTTARGCCKQSCPIIREVRIVGLMIGIELTVEALRSWKPACSDKLLINCTQGNVLRLLPAMTLTLEQVDEGCDILAAALQNASA